METIKDQIKEQIEREKLFQKVLTAYKSRHLLLEAATGSGKSLAAIKLIEEKQRWLIVVPKLVLIENWKEQFIEHGHEAKLKQIDFIAYASLEKWQATGKKRNIILDEAHNMNERRYVAIKDILNMTPLSKVSTGVGHLIALSGSIEEERRYLLHRLGISKLNTVKFTTDDAVGANIIADYRVLVVHLPLNDTYNQILSINKWKKSYDKTEKYVYSLLDDKTEELLEFKIEASESLKKNKTVLTVLEDQIITNPTLETALSEALVKNDVLKAEFADIDKKSLYMTLDRMRFIYNSPSKLIAAKLILKQLNLDRRILTFGSSIEQIEKLCDFTHHSKKSKKDTDFTDFKKGTINRLGAIQTIAEGVNIPNLNTVFVVQSMSKIRHMIQRLGRMLRIDKENPDKKATLIVLSIDDTQDEKWVRNSLSYFDANKVFHTTISEVKSLGIESIIGNLENSLQK